nr:copia protein [Tanacetum cinerariifolium]
MATTDVTYRICQRTDALDAATKNHCFHRQGSWIQCCFYVVLECVLAPVATVRTSPFEIPAIGVAADSFCIHFATKPLDCCRRVDQFKEMELKLHLEVKEALKRLCEDPKTTIVVLKLRSLELRSLSIFEYFKKIKVISDLLSNIESPVSEKNLIMYAVNGLAEKYEHVASIIRHTKTSLTLLETRSMLHLEESHLSRKQGRNNARDTTSSMVLLASHNGAHNKEWEQQQPRFSAQWNNPTGRVLHGHRVTFSPTRPGSMTYASNQNRGMHNNMHGGNMWSGSPIPNGSRGILGSAPSNGPQMVLLAAIKHALSPMVVVNNKIDVKNAFLHGHLSEKVYMHQPPGFVDPTHPNHVCLLQKSLYGLKQAPRAWFQRFASYATRIGFQHSKSDSSLFKIIASLHGEFSMIDLGPLNYFLGISGHRTSSDTDTKLGTYGLPVEDPSFYRSLAGALQYLTFTRPDLSYATLDHGLQLYASSTSQLVAYSDADWAGCPTTRCSTSGYCVFLGDNLPIWSSKRQHVTSRSSAEAEYRGVANVVAETAWVRNLLRELHYPLCTATLVYCDNISAVYLSSNPVQHQRTKHIEIDLHFIRDFVATGHVRVLPVLTKYQYADIFTKGLPSPLFTEFRSSLSVRPSPASTAGAY